IQNSLYSLWQYLHTKGNYGHIIIPLLGTGLARINKSRIDVAKEIIKSFSAAISQGKLCEKLTICISPDDYLKHQLDIDELNEYIQHICKFTNITTSSNGNGGNQLNT
ncbi:MAG: DUF6430 domain-containing protein, partial [Bacteriovoracaceae bacterium]|nr:DUF6430 domain-containing protein [Bacteriovoracaceae bacterium]